MPTPPYERYGLTGNPFRDLSSESVEDIRIFHVNQRLDETLQTIREEVLEKENRAMVAIVGPHGAGKSERVLVTAAEARLKKAFVAALDISPRTPFVLKGLADSLEKAAKAANLVRAFGGPAWLRQIQSLAKAKDGRYDPTEAGKTIARALNESAPAFLLLNDLHNVTAPSEKNAISLLLQSLSDGLRPGSLVLVTCYPGYIIELRKDHPALASRFNRLLPLTALGDDEAALLLAKKLLAKRIVENLDPTYPFDLEAVAALNKAAHGNPRRLLEVADLALERAAGRKAYRVSEETVHQLFPAPVARASGSTPVTTGTAHRSPVPFPSRGTEESGSIATNAAIAEMNQLLNSSIEPASGIWREGNPGTLPRPSRPTEASPGSSGPT